MALIGTISGSVGDGGVLTSATAISGTLIVADSPGSVFPTLPADVKFFVSGVQGAIANSLPGVAVFGGDLRVSGSSYFTDIDVTGHGAVVVQPYGVSAGQTGEVRFKELAANGGNYTALKAADSIAANLHITLPNAVGSNGNVLQTNGSGVTSFVDASSVVTGALSLVSINASSNITGSRFTSNAAGSLAIGDGQVYLNGASSNRIDFSSQGTGDPAFNAPTAGTKVVLYPAAGASATDYALGISPATLWNSIPSTDAAMMFKWFGGTTVLAALSGSGNMEISGDLAVKGGDITTSAGTFNIANTTATTVNLGGGSSAVNIGAAGSAATFAGDITGSNALLSGDLAVNGGDITTTAATINMFANAGVTMNVGPTSAATVVNLNRTTNVSTTNIAGGTNTVAGVIKTVNIASGTGPLATALVSIGSAGALGRITLQQDVALTTGNLIGSPGSGLNVMNLISSGNLIAKMDANNDGGGHKFAIQDYRNIDQFTVFEEGNAELSGSLIVSGSSIQTVTTTTYNLLTTALTGTLNIGSLATNILVGGTTTTSSFTGAAQIDGRATLSSITEKLVPSVGGTGTVAYDLSLASIFYANGPTGNITANFTNVPTTPNNRIITPTVILSQSATPRIVNAVQIDTAAQTINWANGTTPTGTANKQDVFGFSLIRSGSTWKVLGQMSTYG